MSRRIAILQSSYIPWKGYFDLIAGADEFVLYDDAQFTRRDWRNRNRIKTPRGLHWLTIPVETKGNYLQKIRDTRICDDAEWERDHWLTLQHNYAKAPYFREYRHFLGDLYGSVRAEARGSLSRANHFFLSAIRDFLGLSTPLRWSAEFELPEGRNERLVAICRQAKATTYVSGPSARAYLRTDLFAEAGIEVQFMDYKYDEYPQLHPPFEHGVSILDLILNTGSKARTHLRHASR